MEIEKAYFTLPEVLQRWSMTETDLIYLAENDKLRLSVRVFHVPLELGVHEDFGDGDWRCIPHELISFSGLLDLCARDTFQLFRCSEIYLENFRTADYCYAKIYGDADPVSVTVEDLLVRREERDRLEAETGFSNAQPQAALPVFSASPDYHEVRCGGHLFHLGHLQAQVVRALHEAARRGEPWQSGKEVLQIVGSRSLKMSDVFKSQKHWRSLIKSNRRGDYRLNCN